MKDFIRDFMGEEPTIGSEFPPEQSDLKMTLLDYFAGQALIGLTASFTGLGKIPSDVELTCLAYRHAKMAYRYAKMMIKVREEFIDESPCDSNHEFPRL